jgi:hypothetical protein
MTLTFKGVLPALITPFTDDGEAVDTDSLTDVVERCIRAGVAGFVSTGSTGEFMTICCAYSGFGSCRLHSGPISVCSDITMRSRSESMGGFVTCANCCRK